MKTSYGADAILVLSKKGENFGFYELAMTNVPARKAFLPINDPSGAREFTMVFDDVAGISEELRVKSEEFATATDWYTLDGRRFSRKPTKSGVYVKGGKKFVIK